MLNETGFSFEDKHHMRAAWGTWESLAFYRRNGFAESFENTPEWVDTWFEVMNSEEAIKKIADAGVNLVISRYFKGFGLEAEKPDLEYVRRQIKWCKKYGVTYLGYVQALTLVSETFFKEVPEAKAWIRLGPDGEMMHYGGTQTWRKEPSLYHDDFVEYLKKVITQCVVVDGADGVMMDNVGAHPCYCESCQQMFRDYLRESKTFSPEALSLEYLDYDEIRIPRALREFDTLAYEYYCFRRAKQAAAMKALYEHTKSIRPNALYVPNGSAAAITHVNRPAMQEVFPPTAVGFFDGLKNDGAGVPSYDEGDIKSSIKRLKLANAYKTIIIPKNPLGGYTPDVRDDEEVVAHVSAGVAETLTFGGQPSGYMGVLNPTRTDRGRKLNIDYPSVFNTFKRYTDFVETHADVYKGATSAAQVYLYHSAENVLTRPSLMRSVAQEGMNYLLKNHVAFEIVVAGQLDGLTTDSVLFLQDILTMTPAECEEVVRFHKRGGRLLILGATSWYNERAKEVRRIGLADLVSAEALDQWETGMQVRAENLFIEPSPTRELGEKLKLTRKHYSAQRREELDVAAAIDELLPGGLTIRCDAPEYLLIDAYVTRSGDTAVHFCSLQNRTDCEDVRISFALPGPGGAPNVRCESPDGDVKVSTSVKGDRVVVTLDRIRSYALCLFEGTGADDYGRTTTTS